MQVVTLTIPELEEIIETTVQKTVSALRPSSPWMTKAGLKAYTGWSFSTINRKMKLGLPHEGKNGEHPRFHREQVDQWRFGQTIQSEVIQ